MVSKNIAVFGIYHDPSRLEDGVEELRSAGFRAADLSAFSPDEYDTAACGHERQTKAPERAVIGGLAGFLGGAVLGWLAAVAGFVSALPDPAVGALAGSGAGLLVGGLFGAVSGYFRPEYIAIRYSGALRRASVLLSVHCDNHAWARRAQSLLENTGAQEVAKAPEARADFQPSDRPERRPRLPRSSLEY
jgi:hypothetical protein